MFAHALIIEAAHGSGQDRATLIDSGDYTVVVLADGAGGLGSGEKAAELVLSSVQSAIAEGISLASVRPWIPRLMQLDRQLQGVGESTVVVAIVHLGRVLGVSAGDSDAWVVNTSSGFPPRRLTARQKKARLGSGLAQITPFDEFCSSGSLVVGSDGLWNYLAADRAQEIVRASPTQEAARELVEAVRLPSGDLRDDVSVAIVELSRL